jgi:hypothetical protein
MPNFKSQVRLRKGGKQWLNALKLDKTNFKYPISDDHGYGGKIMFTANKGDYATLGEKAIDFLKDDHRFKEQEKDDKDDKDDISAPVTEAFKKSVADRPTRSQKAGYKNISTGRKCTLYLPNAIQIQDKVGYSNIDLGPIGSAVSAGMTSTQSGSEIIAAVGGGIKDTFSSLVASLRGGAVSEEAQLAAMRVFGASSAISGAISSSTGVALNPNKRAVLSGPELRTFGFTFSLIPTSSKEAEEITKIIKFFREEMYPAAMIAGNTGISAAFRYPSVFDIKMKYKTSDGIYKDVATKLLPCFLQAVDVNYNQTGMSFHSDGKPQQATLTLSFTEQRALTEYDVAIGGY